MYVINLISLCAGSQGLIVLRLRYSIVSSPLFNSKLIGLDYCWLSTRQEGLTITTKDTHCGKWHLTMAPKDKQMQPLVLRQVSPFCFRHPLPLLVRLPRSRPFCPSATTTAAAATAPKKQM